MQSSMHFLHLVITLCLFDFPACHMQSPYHYTCFINDWNISGRIIFFVFLTVWNNKIIIHDLQSVKIISFCLKYISWTGFLVMFLILDEKVILPCILYVVLNQNTTFTIFYFLHTSMTMLAWTFSCQAFICHVIFPSYIIHIALSSIYMPC